MKIYHLMAIVAAALFLASTQSATATSDALVLESRILETYPSLLYVDQYRRSFPDEVQAVSFWSPGTTSELKHPADLVRALTALEDQHVAIVGDKAGKTESLGLLFRTATDGAMVVWRIFDAEIGGVRAGDVVLAVDDVATQTWLTQAATLTFGGNRRSRAAEAALDLGLGTPIKHQTAGLRHSVRFLVQSAGEAPRSVTLDFSPMNPQRAAAMTAAVNQADLRPVLRAEGVSIGAARTSKAHPAPPPARRRPPPRRRATAPAALPASSRTNRTTRAHVRPFVASRRTVLLRPSAAIEAGWETLDLGELRGLLTALAAKVVVTSKGTIEYTWREPSAFVPAAGKASDAIKG